MDRNSLLRAALLLTGSAVLTWGQGMLAPAPPLDWNSWASFGTTIYGG